MSLIGVLTLILTVQITKEIQTGIIKSIHPSNNKITIQLKNYSTELVIFDTAPLKLKSGDIIDFQGKSEIYKNKKQIIVDKIFLTNN